MKLIGLVLALFAGLASAQSGGVRLNSLPSGTVSGTYLTICDTGTVTYSCNFSQLATWLANNLPASLPSVTTINGTVIPASSTLLTNSSTTGSGAVVFGTAPVLSAPAITGGTIDATSAVQAAAVTGCCVQLASQAPGSTVYNTTTTYALTQANNGQVIVETSASTCAFTAPAIGSGISSGTQVIIFNNGTNACSFTPTTSTVNNTTVVYLPPQTWAFVQADNSTNYNFFLAGGYTGTSLSALVFPNQIKAPIFVANGTGAVGTNGQGWLGNPATHQVCLGTDTTCKLVIDTNSFMNVEAGLMVDVGTTPPTVAGVNNCTAFGTQLGGLRTGSVVLSTTTGACTFKLTWPTASPGGNGYRCSGSDETAHVQINTIAHTTTSATLLTGTGTANGDVVSYTCEAY